MPSTPRTSRRRRLTSLAAVSLLSLAAVVAVMWWRAPSSSWACELNDTTSGCLSRVELDLSTVDTPVAGLDGLITGFRSFALNPGADRITVGFHTRHEYGDTSPQGAFVAEFDTTTGKATDLFFDTSVQDADASPVFVESMTYSPDGALIAFYVSDGSTSWLQVIDRSSNDRLDRTAEDRWQILQTDAGGAPGCSRLGFSDDNALVQCEGGVFDAKDGTLIERLDEENRFASYSSEFWAWSRSGLTADTGRGAIDAVGVGTGDDWLDIADDADFPRVNHLSFNPTTSLLFRESRTDEWKLFSLAGPRWSNPEIRYDFFDPKTGDLQRSFLTEIDLLDADWNATGNRFATLERDFTVSVFEIG